MDAIPTQVPTYVNVDRSGSSTEVSGSSQIPGIDYNHPLFLHSYDVDGTQIISFQLISIENYSI